MGNFLLKRLFSDRLLGEAETLQVWEETDTGYAMIEERQTPKAGCGPRRWLNLARTINDCKAIFVASLGDKPRSVLEQYGIRPIQSSGFIETNLEAYFSGKESAIETMKGRATPCSEKTGCAGNGGGCL